MSYKILIVEDDILFGQTIAEFLEDNNYSVHHLSDANAAIEHVYDTKYDLYLLDINLPSHNGIELLQMLRQANDRTPAIYLTSSSQSQTLKECFKAGCDDYLTKPFDLDELLLRILAVLRRIYGENLVAFDNYTLNTQAKALYKDNQIVPLKPKPFELLSLLVAHQGKVVTTTQIQERLYAHAKEPSMGAIRVYLNEIKHAIGDGYISNIRGVGYKFEA